MRLTTTRRIAESALMLAVFTALAFQYIRFEVFETEKTALLAILAAIILGANIAEFIQRSQMPRLRHPLVMAVAAFVLVTTISTLFSISPAYSLWGSPTRGHGLITVFIYGILFWQASRSGQRLQEALVPIMAIMIIPMALWALYTHFNPPIYQGEPIFGFRPSSVAGNPNFLAGWMAMFFIFYVGQLYWRVFRSGKPLSRLRLLEFAAYGAVAVLCVWTMYVVAARGAIAGLGVAIVTGGFLLVSLYKHRVIATVFIVLFVAAAGSYLAISQQFQGRSSQWGIGFERIFIPYDESRAVLWETATDIIVRQSEPLTGVDGKTDQWALLRPAFGYGLETLEQIQIRFGDRFLESKWGTNFVERFHNLFFDWAAEVGSMGLLTLIMIYQTALYAGMARLGLIKPSQVWYWLGLQVIFVPVGIWLISTIIYQMEWTALIPLGSAVGSLFATWLWIARHAFTQSDEPFVMTQEKLSVVLLLCIVTAQWIDNQFGFMQLMSQTLFFILLGLLASLTAEPDEVEEAEFVPVRESRYWYAATFVTGLFMLYSFGTAMQSDLISNTSILLDELPLYAGVVFLIGGAAATSTNLQERQELQIESQPQQTNKNKKQRRKQRQQEVTRQPIILILFGIVVLWLMFYGFRQVLIQNSGSMIDAALNNSVGPDSAAVEQAYMLYAINGITLAIVGVLVLFIAIKGLEQFSLSAISSIFISVLLAGSIYLYATNFSVSSMRAAGRGFTERGRADSIIQPLIAADAIFKEAVGNAPGDPKLRLTYSDSLLSQIGLINNQEYRLQLMARAEAEREAALDQAPFFVNSRTWEVFDDRYRIFAQRFGTSTVSQPENQTQQQQPQQPQTQNGEQNGQFALPPALATQLAGGVPGGPTNAQPLATSLPPPMPTNTSP